MTYHFTDSQIQSGNLTDWQHHNNNMELLSALGIKTVFLYHNSQQLNFRPPITAAADIPYSTMNTYQASYHHIDPTYFSLSFQ